MIKKKLEWKNLKDGYCPNCYRELDEHDTSWHCTACPFNISKRRYSEIMEDMTKEQRANESFDEHLESWD